MRTLLLVRNGVSHDARVLRAARVAERTLGGGVLVVGVATASAPTGETTVEGVRVLRLPARGRWAPSPKGADVPIDPASAAPAPANPAPTTPASTTSARRPRSRQLATTEHPPGRMRWRARARRVISGASFAWGALRVARRERPALVHANDWNTMWCAAAIKLTCGARVVYDSHELWADRNGRWERRWWLLASEALFLRVADAVITASPGYADALAARYRVARPTVIRNIPDGPHPWESTNGHAAADHARLMQPPSVVYVGGLMPGRGLEQTIDALALTEAIQVRMVGPGTPHYRTSLLERATSAGVADRVRLEPPVPPAQVPALLERATVGLCLIQPICRSYELTLPNKLFEYAAAGLPVLASDLPVIARIVREWGIGEVVAPADPRAIADALTRLCAPGAWDAAAARTLAFAAAHTWEQEAEGLENIYARVTKATKAPHASNGSTARRSQAGSGRSADSPFVHSAP
jgi:glycosyltransferase involved in cell wall biosynthesis